MTLRRCAIAAVTVLSVAAVSACGSGDSNNTASPGKVSTSVDGSTGSTDTGNGSDSGSGSGDNSSLTKAEFGSAVADALASAGSFHMSMTTNAAGVAVRMNGGIDGVGGDVDQLAMSLNLTIPSTGKVQMRIVDQALYMKAPGLGSATGGKPWAKIPLDDPSNPMGSFFQQIMSIADPDLMEVTYGTAIKKFTDLGSQTVDGVDTEHFRVSVNTAKVIKSSGLGDIGGVPLSQILKNMPKQTTSDMWIDSDNHIVKLSSKTSAGTYAVHYSGWGEPVHVSAPPAKQVQSLTF